MDSRRSWLFLAVALLLVATFLAAYTTYARSHVAPLAYRRLGPGVPGTSQGTDFRLIGLRQTDHLGADDYGAQVSPAPGAVWVVADLDVTRREPEPYFACLFTLVGTTRRVWETHGGGGVRPDGVESCTPADARLGTTYRVQVTFEVPADESSRIAGVALGSRTSAPTQLLTPAV